MNVNQILASTEIVRIKSMDILAHAMLVTLMKTAQQVNSKIFVFLFQLCITVNNCLNIIDCQRNICVRGTCTFQINGYVCILITGYTKKKKTVS